MDSIKVHRAWLALRAAYALTALLIGLDKCITGLLVNWELYVSPWVMTLMPLATTINQFVLLTAVIEIVAGILVWVYPRWGGYVICAWMVLVIINLASMGAFYDIIARDAVIAVGALALAWLSEAQTYPVGMSRAR